MGKVENIKSSYKLYCNYCGDGRVCPKLLRYIKQTRQFCNCVKKKGHSFYVIKCVHNSLTATVFHSGHLNITGVAHTFGVVNLRPWIRKHLSIVGISAKFISIDNITYSFKVNLVQHNANGINLIQVNNYFINCYIPFSNLTIISVKYNPDRFAAVFVKFSVGCLLIFRTGSCIIVGCKQLSHCRIIEQLFQQSVCRKLLNLLPVAKVLP